VAGLVGGDVLNDVGCGCARVDDDVAHERAVEEGFYAEVEVGKWRGDYRAEVVVGVADVDVRMLKTLARERTKTTVIARRLKRTPAATKQKAVRLGVPLGGGRKKRGA
jgi:hypothetical protein